MVTKQEVIELGITKIVSRYDYADWLSRKKDVPIDFDVELEYFRILEFYGEEYIKKARNINNNNYLREKRIKRKIQNYVAFGSCVFATLTFTDDVLNSTDENTRTRRSISYTYGTFQYFSSAYMNKKTPDNTYGYRLCIHLKPIER